MRLNQMSKAKIMSYFPESKRESVDEILHDSDGTWIILKEGWNADNMDYRCRTIHEDTVTELKYQISGVRKLSEDEMMEE